VVDEFEVLPQVCVPSWPPALVHALVAPSTQTQPVWFFKFHTHWLLFPQPAPTVAHIGTFVSHASGELQTGAGVPVQQVDAGMGPGPTPAQLLIEIKTPKSPAAPATVSERRIKFGRFIGHDTFN
jgi:hypothetical protein